MQTTLGLPVKESSTEKKQEEKHEELEGDSQTHNLENIIGNRHHNLHHQNNNNSCFRI